MNEPSRPMSGARILAMVGGALVASALLCCGGSALIIRLTTPNVWKLMTMSAEDFAVTPDGGP